MDVTATWHSDIMAYRLNATGASENVTWYRSAYWPDGRSRNAGVGTGLQVFDLTVPLDGATVIYTAVDSLGAVEETAALHPVSDLPVLGLHLRPEFPAASLIIESFREQTVQARTVYYDVLDKNEPYYQAMRPSTRFGTMVLLVKHPGGPFPNMMIDRLRKMLRTGEPMVLRTTCNERVEDLIFLFEQWTEAQTGTGNQHGPDRRITINWRAIDGSWDTLATSGRVWGMVPVEFATWGDVVAQVPTWQDLVEGLP